MDRIYPEECVYSDFEYSCDSDGNPYDGAFIHQHYCPHYCHSGPTGFGHILICCGAEVATTSFTKCSIRCQRPSKDSVGLVDPPDCPNCGPWTHEANLLCLMEAIEWWFHYFGLFPETSKLRQRNEKKLREYQEEVLEKMDLKWTAVYAAVNSIHALRERLIDEVESTKPKPDSKAASPPLPVKDQKHRDWYKSPDVPPPIASIGALDDFLQHRNGALDFYCEGDKGGLRAEMIAVINEGRQRALTTLNEGDEVTMRRLVALFERNLFRNHIINIGRSRPDLVECVKQQLLYNAEHLVWRSGGYWNSVSELVGSKGGLDLSLDALSKNSSWMRDRKLLDPLQPVFNWLEMAEIAELKFRTGKTLLRGFTYASARELLNDTVDCFLEIATLLKASPDNTLPWNQIQARIMVLKSGMVLK